MFARLLSLSLALLALTTLLLAQAPPSAASPSPSPSPFQPPRQSPSFATCYRNYDQVTAFLQSVAASHPQIATLSDAGPSWGGTRHLWLMRLGSGGGPASEPRPTIFLLAGQHPRDIATIEVLLRFVDHLANNYGLDPNVTWLLDNRWIFILPLPNPDGYVRAYSDVPGWSKNTNSGNGCGDPFSWGTNLNRNYPYKWNHGGSSNQPCDSTYRGPSALSEPESRHVLSAFQASGRPADLVISLQAPGPSVLYPWGWTSAAPPDAPALDAFAWSLGRLNGTTRANVRRHNPGPANSPTSGILDDTVYGQFDAPAFTLNIGNASAPTCTELEQIWTSQRPALLQAARAVGTGKADTLAHAFGPEVTQLSIGPGASPGVIQVSAVVSANYGTVAGAVYTIDGNPDGGPTTPMSGSFGAATASVSAQVDTGGLAPGRHLLTVRGKNDADQWGVSSSLFFTTTALPTSTSTSTPMPTDTPALSGSATSTATSSPHTSTPGSTPTATITPIPTFTNTAVAIATSTPTEANTA
ncbi:MAG TPA: M14 family zinc carboxypeptidase, partial [Chloroflexia bacterium]|nr:M14 family zinc carboxypeptidase [Chloroflexia bacterium]